jgi:hypothetical protein
MIGHDASSLHEPITMDCPCVFIGIFPDPAYLLSDLTRENGRVPGSAREPLRPLFIAFHTHSICSERSPCYRTRMARLIAHYH